MAGTRKSNYLTKKPVRIIGKNLKISADERTLSNLNSMVIGSTGSGKTLGYVSPNIKASESESMVVIDSKLNLYRQHRSELEAKGYQVELIDLVNLGNSTIGYNPLDYIRTVGDKASVDDIRELAGFIVADEFYSSKVDKYWETSAREYIACCISLCMHILPEEEHNLVYVGKLLDMIDTPEWNLLTEIARSDDPECFEVKINKQIMTSRRADRMHGSTAGIAQSAMNHLLFDSSEKLYTMKKRIDFAALGEKRMAVFIDVPDHDFTKGPLVSMFFSQCIKALLDHADKQKRSRLKVPVHLFADDIGSSFCIPHLPELLSISRSRSIYLSLLLQNIGQLESKYGPHDASTIAGNCSTVLYLGGTDIETPKFFSEKANLPLEKVTGMPIDEELVCISGQSPFFAKKNNAQFLPVEYVREEQSLQDDACADPECGKTV